VIGTAEELAAGDFSTAMSPNCTKKSLHSIHCGSAGGDVVAAGAAAAAAGS